MNKKMALNINIRIDNHTLCKLRAISDLEEGNISLTVRRLIRKEYSNKFNVTENGVSNKSGSDPEVIGADYDQAAPMAELSKGGQGQGSGGSNTRFEGIKAAVIGEPAGG